ncbi:MAG: RDD family protein [Puniceicoccales bacterium]|jgi:uncharacterized RDD family membrane protein YckC|nr:RDD family protein [Puniceicoccales bacterium]
MDNYKLSDPFMLERASLSRRFWAFSLDMILVSGLSTSLLALWVFPSYFQEPWQDLLRLIRSETLVTSLIPFQILHMLWVGQKISFLVTWIYFGASEGIWRGRTLGKAILALRSLSSPLHSGQDGDGIFLTSPKAWQQILRSWLKALAAFSPFFLLDLLPLCFPSARRRCLHDLLSRSCVVLDRVE